jgi:hypothetical protein
MFTNLAIIRRYYIEKIPSNKNKKKEVKEWE